MQHFYITLCHIRKDLLLDLVISPNFLFLQLNFLTNLFISSQFKQ